MTAKIVLPRRTSAATSRPRRARRWPACPGSWGSADRAPPPQDALARTLLIVPHFCHGRRRYDSSKLEREPGWRAQENLESGIRKTVPILTNSRGGEGIVERGYGAKRWAQPLGHAWACGYGLSLRPPALRRNDNDSRAFQNAAEVHAAEITELECNLADQEPDQPGGKAEQSDEDPGLHKHGESQYQ